MRLTATLTIFIWAAATGQSAATRPADETAVKPGIPARVDPRVELMSIIFRLAGNPEYSHKLSRSPYADEVEAHFGAFRDHPVVATARQLRGKRGVSFDAVAGMSVHITDTETLAERIPFDEKPVRLDGRWRVKEARDFLDKARQFVKDTEFNAFFARHRPLYAEASRRMTETLSERDYRGWFDSFFGARPESDFSVIVGMLNGPSNYGAGVRYPDGREELSPILGASVFDREGIPVFSPGIASLVVHEFCHSYTNPLVNKYADQLEPAGMLLYPHYQEKMTQQAYGNWKTMMYESMVRACQVRYAATDGKAAEVKQVLYQYRRGFKWTGPLSKLLEEYETHRDRYPTLDAFMPKVVAFFNEYAEQHERRKKHLSSDQ